MDALKDGAPPEFLSTHPSGGTRMRGLSNTCLKLCEYIKIVLELASNFLVTR